MVTRKRALGIGVYIRNRPKPYKVRFTRNKKEVYLGSFASRKVAISIAANFLRNENVNFNK